MATAGAQIPKGDIFLFVLGEFHLSIEFSCALVFLQKNSHKIWKPKVKWSAMVSI